MTLRCNSTACLLCTLELAADMSNSVPARSILFQKFMVFQTRLSRNAEAMNYCIEDCQNEEVKKLAHYIFQ